MTRQGFLHQGIDCVAIGGTQESEAVTLTQA